jgi:hypothetical protein
MKSNIIFFARYANVFVLCVFKVLAYLICFIFMQDPYFRMTRDVAPRLGYQKP